MKTANNTQLRNYDQESIVLQNELESRSHGVRKQLAMVKGTEPSSQKQCQGWTVDSDFCWISKWNLKTIIYTNLTGSRTRP